MAPKIMLFVVKPVISLYPRTKGEIMSQIPTKIWKTIHQNSVLMRSHLLSVLGSVTPSHPLPHPSTLNLNFQKMNLKIESIKKV